MLANLKVVGSDSVPHPTHGVLLLVLGRGVKVLQLTIENRVLKETLLLLCIVHTEGGTNHEVLERSNAEVNVAESTPLSIFVVLIALEDT